MDKELAEVLGKKPDTKWEELLDIVKHIKFELDAKMGYASISLIDKLKRDGYIRFNPEALTWDLRLSDREMRQILGESY